MHALSGPAGIAAGYRGCLPADRGQLGGAAPPVDTSPDNATARVWTHRRGVEAAAGNEASRIVPTDALGPRLASRSGLIVGKIPASVHRSGPRERGRAQAGHPLRAASDVAIAGLTAELKEAHSVRRRCCRRLRHAERPKPLPLAVGWSTGASQRRAALGVGRITANAPGRIPAARPRGCKPEPQNIPPRVSLRVERARTFPTIWFLGKVGGRSSRQSRTLMPPDTAHQASFSAKSIPGASAAVRASSASIAVYR